MSKDNEDLTYEEKELRKVLMYNKPRRIKELKTDTLKGYCLLCRTKLDKPSKRFCDSYCKSRYNAIRGRFLRLGYNKAKQDTIKKIKKRLKEDKETVLFHLFGEKGCSKENLRNFDEWINERLGGV